MKSTEIKKLTIKMGKHEVDLTPDEARELRDVLDDLFGKSERIVTVPQPYIVPTYPYRWWYYEPSWKYMPTDTITVSYTADNSSS